MKQIDEKGGCHCGAVRYHVKGELIFGEHCHCEDCRRTSGAPFLSWGIANGELNWTGEPKMYASSDLASRGFCPECGTQVCYRFNEHPEWLVFTLGSLDNPEKVEPAFHIFTRSQLKWADLGKHLPHHKARAPRE